MTESIQEVYSATSKFFAEIVNKKDEYVQKRMLDYAKEHAKQFGENVEVLFLDEDKVKQIIQLGIQDYLQRDKKPGMTEKEREAIDKLSNFKTISVLYGNTYAMHIEQLKQLQENIHITLNLLEKQQSEIEKDKDFISYLQLKDIERLEQNIKKDKIIDYMSNFINDNTPYTKDTRVLENQRGVRNTKYTKQYFENKIESDKK